MKQSFAVKCIFALLLNLLVVNGNIVDLNHYKLSENSIRVSSRYVFSDFNLDKDKPLKDAELQIDIGAYLDNYNNLLNSTRQFGEDHIRLYILLVNSEAVKEVQYTLQNNQKLMEKYNCTFSYLMNPYKNFIPLFKQIDINSDNREGNRMDGSYISGNPDGKSHFDSSSPLFYNVTEKVLKEDIYYLAFFYEVMNKEKTLNEMNSLKNNRDFSNLDNRFVYHRFNKGHNHQFRLLNETEDDASYNETIDSEIGTVTVEHQSSQNQDISLVQAPVHLKTKQNDEHSEHQYRHVYITGQLIFKNSHGYLSAQIYPEIGINAFFMSVYIILYAVFGFVLYRHRQLTHKIHLIILGISGYCVAFSMINLIYYSLKNSYNYDSSLLLALGWFIWVSCSVAGRVVTLAVAYGYMINKKSISEHYFKIVILMIATSFSLAAELIVQYYQYDYQISRISVISSHVPHMVCELIFFVWILQSFRKNVAELLRRDQTEKSVIVTQMFINYLISMFVLIILKILHFVRYVNLDEDWKSAPYLSNSFFLVYTISLGLTMVILRPFDYKFQLTFEQLKEIRETDDQQVLRLENMRQGNMFGIEINEDNQIHSEYGVTSRPLTAEDNKGFDTVRSLAVIESNEEEGLTGVKEKDFPQQIIYKSSQKQTGYKNQNY